MEQGTAATGRGGDYVLMTAARNEAAYIETTIQAVMGQTRLPKRWIIVNDGSTDATEQMVQRYSSRHGFMTLLTLPTGHQHDFGAKVAALGRAYQLVQGEEFEFIGNLDADMDLDRDYYGELLARFGGDAKLGIGGGFVHEKQGSEFRSRATNSTAAVAHAAQLMRRACYEAIGGYQPLAHGGEDTCAEISARMKGWSVRSFPELAVRHLKPSGATLAGQLRHRIRQGLMDFSLGYDPLFEVHKCARRLLERPIFAGGAARMLGFAWGYCCGEKRLVSSEFVSFLRREQKGRLRSWYGRPQPRRQYPGAVTEVTREP